MKDVVRHYLDRYAESWSAPLPKRAYRHVLVVPAYDEDVDFVERLLPDDASDVLVIVVANVPDEARDPAPIERTRALAARFPGLTPLDARRRIDVLGVDRTNGNRRLPRRQGVGLARKIGADLALRCIAAGVVASPVIYGTDADATLPSGYFGAATGERAAWVYPFRHASADPTLAAKALVYELHLRYYVNRLRFAGSPYAYHSIGSTIAADARAYAAVRGFPRRSAGEDFYLLNKLAKVGAVETLRGPAIRLEARRSQRVPFGTGPALDRIGAASDFASYAPESFALLKTFLEQAGAAPPAAIAPEFLALVPGLETFRARSTTPGVRPLHVWFDAFRTLKFVHAARERFPDRALLATLRSLFPECGADPAALNDALIEIETMHAGTRGV